MNAWLVIRLLLALLLGSLALHVVTTFYTLLAWKLTLLATEYGHRLALLALFIALAGFWKSGWMTHAGTFLLVASAVLLLIPLVQAHTIAQTLVSDLHVPFHDAKRSTEAPPKLFHGLWIPDRPEARKPEVFDYFKVATESRKLYFYRAANRTNAPCIIVLHSGGWENGTVDEFCEWSRYWSSRGFAVASVEYRLSPEHHWPAPRDDVRLALAWMKEKAAQLGIDSAFFILLGRSAGMQIATTCAYGLNDPAIRGCVALYGPADLIFARRHTPEHDVLDSVRLMRNYIGADIDEAETSYCDASSLFLATARSCPTLIAHGRRDTLVWYRQSERLAARLRELNVTHFHLELPWATHSFDWPFDGPAAQLTRVSVDVFLDYLMNLER